MKKLNLTVENMQPVAEVKHANSEKSRSSTKMNPGKVSQAELARSLDGNGAIKSASLRLCGPCGG